MPTTPNPKSLGKKLIDLATDPEQYSTGEAVSWLQDPERQDLQRQQFWNGIKDYIPKGCKSMLDVGCGISDINRRPSFYIDSAQKSGLSLLKQDQILDSGYSPKDLLVFTKSS